MEDLDDEEDSEFLREGVYDPARRFGISCEFEVGKLDNLAWFHLQVHRKNGLRLRISSDQEWMF